MNPQVAVRLNHAGMNADGRTRYFQPFAWGKIVHSDLRASLDSFRRLILVETIRGRQARTSHASDAASVKRNSGILCLMVRFRTSGLFSKSIFLLNDCGEMIRAAGILAQGRCYRFGVSFSDHRQNFFLPLGPPETEPGKGF